MFGLAYQVKLFVFNRDSYFWKKQAVVFGCNLSLITVKNLCPNF